MSTITERIGQMFERPSTSVPSRTEGDVRVIELQGQLIVGNRQLVKEQVLNELASGRRLFVLDFANVGYVDASGFGVLISLQKKIRDAGGRFALAGMSDELHTCFTLIGLNTYLHHEHSLEAALSYVRFDV